MCKEWREIDSRSNGMDIYREMKEKKWYGINERNLAEE